MSLCDIVIGNEKYSLVIKEGKVYPNCFREYWGIDTQRKSLYIFNTRNEELIAKFIFQAQHQYRK